MNLFPSTLVINCSLEKLDELLASVGHSQIQNNPDIFELTEYTIAAVRQIGNFLANLPLSHDSKIVIIQNAHLLSIEAQNALLKNLEEPGNNNYFILTTTRPHSLLPTIVSRCQIIQNPVISTSSLPLLIIPASPVEKLLLSESLVGDKTSTINYLETQLQLYQQKLITDPSLQNQKIIKKIIKSIALIKANVDPKSALDFLLLS